jgi:hypothetical protein
LAARKPDMGDVLPETCDSEEDLGSPDESDEDASLSGRS